MSGRAENLAADGYGARSAVVYENATTQKISTKQDRLCLTQVHPNKTPFAVGAEIGNENHSEVDQMFLFATHSVQFCLSMGVRLSLSAIFSSIFF